MSGVETMAMACRRILVVEDDAGIRESIRDLLELEGYQVTTACNGREALDLLEDLERPCLILLDLMMPVMDGWRFLELLAEGYQDVLASIPVAVVSAAADVGDLPQRYGCQVLKKPTDIDVLLETAQQYCELTG